MGKRKSDPSEGRGLKFKRARTSDATDLDIDAHVEELKALNEEDPDFHKFLRENDPDLLTFGEEDGADDEEKRSEKERSAFEEEGDAENDTRRELQELTKERLDAVIDETRRTLTLKSLESLLQAYRCVVRFLSLSSPDPQKKHLQAPDPKKLCKIISRQREKGKVGKQPQSAPEVAPDGQTLLPRSGFVLPSDTEPDSAFNWLDAALYAALDLFPQCLAKHLKLKAARKLRGDTSASDDAREIPLFNPKQCTWRVRRVNDVFWTDTVALLKFLQGKTAFPQVVQCQMGVMARISRSSFLRCLAFNEERRVFIRAVVALWLEARKLSPPQLEKNPTLCLLCLRETLRLVGRPGFHAETNAGRKAQEEDLALVVKAFRRLAEKVGVTWKSACGFQFILNGLTELLASVHPAVAYGTALAAIRQLARAARNAAVSRSRQSASGIVSGSGSGIKRKAKSELAGRVLHCWSFILTARWLAQSLGSLPNLHPLAFPLSTVLSSAVKIDLASASLAPFLLHLLKIQCNISENTGRYIPLGSQLVALGGLLVRRAEDGTSKAARPGDSTSATGVAKTPDIQVLLRLGDSQIQQSSEQLIEFWVDILTDHLGLLAKHPAFPEVSSPLLYNIKRFSKSKNASVRRELRELLEVCEKSATTIKKLRYNMSPQDPALPSDSLFILADSRPSGSRKVSVEVENYRKQRLSDRRKSFVQRVTSTFSDAPTGG